MKDILDLKNKEDVELWCGHFGISENDLQKIVKKVGNRIEYIRREISRGIRNGDIKKIK